MMPPRRPYWARFICLVSLGWMVASAGCGGRPLKSGSAGASGGTDLSGGAGSGVDAAATDATGSGGEGVSGAAGSSGSGTAATAGTSGPAGGSTPGGNGGTGGGWGPGNAGAPGGGGGQWQRWDRNWVARDGRGRQRRPRPVGEWVCRRHRLLERFLRRRCLLQRALLVGVSDLCRRGRTSGELCRPPRGAPVCSPRTVQRAGGDGGRDLRRPGHLRSHEAHHQLRSLHLRSGGGRLSRPLRQRR